MNNKLKLTIKFAVSVTITALMVFFAEILNEPEIIFPEIAALTVGAFITPRMPWNVTPIRMLILMSLSALMGYGLSVFVPLPLYIKVVIAFTVCILTLSAAGSTMLPMISAGVLPLLTNVQSMIYPISVLILTAIIIGVRALLEKYKLADEIIFSVERPEPKEELIRKIWLIIIFAAVAGVAISSGMIFIIAPPLAVVFAETAYIDSPVHKAPFRFFLCIVLCAFAGTSCRLIFFDLFRMPMTVGVTVSVSAAIFLLVLFQKPFPPAAALAVLPFIINESAVALYPFQVTIGAAVFISLNLLYKKAVNKGIFIRIVNWIIDFVKSTQIIQPQRKPVPTEKDMAEKYDEFVMPVEVVTETPVKESNIRRRL